MRETIVFKVTKGLLRDAEFSFDHAQLCSVGRQSDCSIVLPDAKVTRRHCEIEIGRSHVRVRDLDSMNGTYLNGNLIGRRGQNAAAGEGAGFVDMNDGDCLGIGSECELTLSIHIEDEVGEAIAGYQVVGTLGHGGMGRVLRVRKRESAKAALAEADRVTFAEADKSADPAGNTVDDTEFALKLMDMRGIVKEQDRLRFLRGATLAEQLDHPHIVRQYDNGSYQGMHYIVCELCPGGSVFDLMKRTGGPLSVDMATHIILQVLEALDYAHHAKLIRSDGKAKIGLVHRDIQPGNILLMDASVMPVAKVGDFGISRLFEAAGSTRVENLIDPSGSGDFAGTPDFTPAVQIMHYKEAKPEVDVWAAAATYYYMLTGLPPKDLRYADKWELALLEKAIPIRERKADIPARLAETIDAALVEEPAIGCQSAREFQRRIEAAL